MEDNAIFASEVTRAVTGTETEYGLSQAVQERAQVLGKWLWLYFWIEIGALVPGIIAAVEETVESGTMIGQIIGWGFSAAMVVCLFQAGKMQDRLRTSAGMSLISLAATMILTLVGSEVASDLWAIPGGIIGLVASYQYMHGCAESLMGVDNDLSGKWEQLWKWRILTLVAMMIGAPVSALVIFAFRNSLALILAIPALLALVICVFAVMILEVVYTYRTAKIFRGIAANL